MRFMMLMIPADVQATAGGLRLVRVSGHAN